MRTRHPKFEPPRNLKTFMILGTFGALTPLGLPKHRNSTNKTSKQTASSLVDDQEETHRSSGAHPASG